MKYQEEIAEPPFKPSTIERDLAGTYSTLRLKDKGVSYSEIFTKFEWAKGSFMSFVGVYGYFNVFGPKYYYLAMAILYGLFGAYLLAVICGTETGTRSRSPRSCRRRRRYKRRSAEPSHMRRQSVPRHRAKLVA